MSKVCSRCKVKKDESEFYKNSKKRDGCGSYCKECLKIYAKEYRTGNPDYYKDYNASWRKTKSGAESISASRKKYLKTQKCKDKRKEYFSMERTKDLVKLSKMNANRVFYYTKESAKKRNINFNFTLDEFVEFYTRNDKCFYCSLAITDTNRILSVIREYNGFDEDIMSLKKKTSASNFYSKRFSVDRMDSLGEYSEKNCVISCQICNAAKGFFISADDYKLIAKSTIGRIINICKEAGFDASDLS